MKLKDVNIKVARFNPRNTMVMINFIYFKCKVTNFHMNMKNPNFENDCEIVFVQQIKQLIEGL